MKKCKWAGDVNDEYCKGCNGITMEVDGNSISCTECAGYESSEDEVSEETTNNNFMPEPEEELPFEEEQIKSVEKNDKKQTKEEKTTNNTTLKEKVKTDTKNKETTNKEKVTKVSEEKKSVETTKNVDDEIKVTAIRYTSGATIKKGDNYFKFIAEEEWDVSRIEDVQEAREKLWAKLNAEVDSQIEELNNMN